MERCLTHVHESRGVVCSPEVRTREGEEGVQLREPRLHERLSQRSSDDDVTQRVSDETSEKIDTHTQA